jgi:sulfatase maturation enzyme AslB (radical SAM superfamily)
MVGPVEIARRVRSRASHRLESVPILALSVHSACNCRCVMCDIWKANSEKREISADDLDRHIDAIRALRVQRVMLTGGEPLLHRNLWALCLKLQALRIRVTLVTTGLLIEPHAAGIAAAADTVVISLDGDREAHDRVRRVKGGFDRIARGVMALRGEYPAPRLIARSVVQRDNFAQLPQTIDAAHHMGFDEISFLAADVSSPAFNRPEPWSAGRIAEVAITNEDLRGLETAIDRAVSHSPALSRRPPSYFATDSSPAAGRRSTGSCSTTARYRAAERSPRCNATRRGCRPCSSPTAMCGPVSSSLPTDRRRTASWTR